MGPQDLLVDDLQGPQGLEGGLLGQLVGDLRVLQGPQGLWEGLQGQRVGDLHCPQGL